MRNRFISFFVFQLIAWTLYFNWDVEELPVPAARQKYMEVSEISPRQVNQGVSFKNNYRLILRNDGIFTRINADQTIENGLWKMDYQVPAIILTSARGDLQYQILTSGEDRMNVRKVISNDEFTRNLTQTNDLKRLLSTFELKP